MLCTFVKALKHQQLTWIRLKLDSQVKKLWHTEGDGGLPPPPPPLEDSWVYATVKKKG